MKVKNLLEEGETQPKPIPLQIEVFSPWSNLIVKFKMPDDIFEEVQKLYEYTMKDWSSFGSQLVGQVNEEPEVTPKILSKFPKWGNFCLSCVNNFAVSQSQVNYAAEPEKIAKYNPEDIVSKINTMWFVRQKPGEYNPAHVHTNCKVSAIAYLQTPKEQVKGRKDHYQVDGKVTFMNNTGTDTNFSNAQCTFEPRAGDMYVFGALQHHMVWPYRSANPDDLRISLSFNADLTTKQGIQNAREQQEIMFKEMKKMKESENDKGLTDGNINKSG